MSVFISHASADNGFVQGLRQALAFSGVPVWVDIWELAAGDVLQAVIQRAIEEAPAVVVVVSPNTFNSRWVKKELDHARAAGKRVVALLLDDMQLGSLAWLFGELEPLAVQVSTGAGGLEAALPAILAGLGERLPEDPPEPEQADEMEPVVSELLLVLEHPTLYTEEGKRRGMARARLEFHPADGSPAVESEEFAFISPLGPIEAERLKWYIEEFPRYPFLEKILERAEEVAAQIKQWGQWLFETITADESARALLLEWKGERHHERRFTVKLDANPPGRLEAEARQRALEGASVLLSTPWEILHDGTNYLFQGQQPVRVRRMQPNRRRREALPPQELLRILLVVPRPEDEVAALIDHRGTTRALLDAVEALGPRAELDILDTPTFAALAQRIREAAQAGKPYTVVHFDGHGVFDRRRGLGALCFESGEAAEQAKTEGRATHIVDAAELAAELNELRIPLFFLDACQTAMTDYDPTASVAAKLLENGVASVAAMSHSVLVVTAGKFAAAFYSKLAEGALIGAAMLEGQRHLHADTLRLELPRGEKLRLQDWFVPVLFQEKKDPQLVRRSGLRPLAADLDEKARKIRLGDTPTEPRHGFVGRDRELLALERLLVRERWAVLLGQGGAGKTTLAAEFARWMLRTRRFGRLAFVSFEYLGDVRSALDSLGKQLVADTYSVATFENEEKAWLPLERALREYPTLLVLDNLESVLPDTAGGQPPPGVAAPEVFSAFFQRLLAAAGRTRLLLTSRQRLPGPFDRAAAELRLGALTPYDALRLIAHVMRSEGIAVPSLNAEDLDTQFGTLARTANYHARALTLLTRLLAQQHSSLPALNDDLSKLMAELERRHPGERENSLYASLELSLQRLPADTRQALQVLAVFHGGADVVTWAHILGQEPQTLTPVVQAMVGVGLAEVAHPIYVRLDPALPAYLTQRATPQQLDEWRRKWAEGMEGFTGFLYQQQTQDIQLAAGLTRLAEQNLLAFLIYISMHAEPERTMDLLDSIERLFSRLGRPQVLILTKNLRERISSLLGAWGHAQFLSKKAKIDHLLEEGNITEVCTEAQHLLQQCLDAGADAYDGIDYDTAVAQITLGLVLKMSGRPEQALPLLTESQEQFRQLAQQGIKAAERMASACLTEKGGCYLLLGRYEEAATHYQKALELDEKRGDHRDVAVGKSQLASVRAEQKQYAEALSLLFESKTIFEQIGEPLSVATAWHQIGGTYLESNQHDAAEKAYLESLKIKIQQKNQPGEASTLGQLGNLYDATGRLEDAIRVYERAGKIYADLGNLQYEGFISTNLADTFIKLGKFDEARKKLHRAIECDSQFGHAAMPWKTWGILQKLERQAGNVQDALRARQKAIQSYTIYRRDGGESQSNRRKWFPAAYQAVQSRQAEEMAIQLEQTVEPGDHLSYIACVRQITAILRGNRDPALADNPELSYIDAAELLLLLEQLRAEGM